MVDTFDIKIGLQPARSGSILRVLLSREQKHPTCCCNLGLPSKRHHEAKVKMKRELAQRIEKKSKKRKKRQSKKTRKDKETKRQREKRGQ
jgi:hypothetical protein